MRQTDQVQPCPITLLCSSPPQVKKELAVHQREQRVIAEPHVVPGPMNLPGIENKGEGPHYIPILGLNEPPAVN